MAPCGQNATAPGRERSDESLHVTVAQSSNVVYFPAIVSSSHLGISDEIDEWTISFRDWEAYEQSRARNADGYREFVSYLLAARTLKDYLNAEHILHERLRHYPENNSTMFSRLAVMLATLAEAIHWSESHPYGPALCNVDLLQSKIKTVIIQEAHWVGVRRHIR